VIDITGAVVLDLLIKPRRAIPADATRIHGITNTMVSNWPTWVHVQKSIMDALQWHNIVIYNADYDLRVIHQTDKGWAVQDSLLSIQSAYCAMLNYAAFVGEWNEYRGSFRWQKLSGGDHSALGDCRATLDLIKRMAAAKMSYESDTVI
jgi:DNA polymerase-3 subunit epsilon